MKVGIATYHRSLNYGAVLQAIALRKVLVEQGHDVFFVDYWPKYHRELYSLFKRSEMLKMNTKDKVVYIIYRILKRSLPLLHRRRNFTSFLNSHVFPFCKPMAESFDLVVYGSDQIWRKQPIIEMYDPYYFGENNLSANIHASYAASIGVLPDNTEDSERVVSLVDRLDRVSVRESDLLFFFEEHGIACVRKDLDPTLLLSKQAWSQYARDKAFVDGKYVLIYGITYHEFSRKKVDVFAAERGLHVIELLGDSGNGDANGKYTTLGPESFLSLIEHAEYVFVSSFHGVAFSIIFNKQFYASLTQNSSRVSSLLNSLGIEERMIAPFGNIPELEEIDYHAVNLKLEAMKNDSVDYLRSLGSCLRHK